MSKHVLRAPVRSLAVLVVGGAVAAALSAAPARVESAGAATARPDSCPPGFEPAARTTKALGNATVDDALLQSLDAQDATARGCVNARRPESAAELMRQTSQANARATAPFSAVAPGAYAAGMAQRAAIARGAPVPGTGGSWTPHGKGQLIGDSPDYPEINGLGITEMAGRIQDFSYDEASGVLYVSVASGGVYKSADRGRTWIDISQTLPNLTVASVAYTPARGGTLVVLTGDSNGGGNSFVGSGGYFSGDGGKSWQQSSGLPEGVLGFRVTFDPTNPAEVYAATGAGLFRSLDAGRTYQNVNLPTGDCAGKPAVYPCFFANQVTDVVVQAPDSFGNTGGRVVAAVGWRAGPKEDRQGNPQAPANGLYGSDTGDPDSFALLPMTGFAAQPQIGRTELGTTTGPDQNHDYLYAIVQDAVKFNGGVTNTDANEPTAPVVGYNTALNGIYVSNDFGSTWVLLQDGDDIAQTSPAAGSALGVTAQALGSAPGVQAWYNEWILPDPTRTDPVTGAPTRLLFGLEEVWQNEVTTAPVIGPTRFKVIGRYFSGSTCFFLDAGLPYCPVNRGEPAGGLTTHPDQHGAIFLPGPDEGAVTLLVGNDGGVWVQEAAEGDEFTNAEWGPGSNTGFHTLLPYSVAVAKDGTVWGGLQDNGHMKIQKGTELQYMTYGGDGTWAETDPNDGEVAYSATPGGGMRFTTDGGTSWTNMSYSIKAAQFVNQFVLDPLDSDHLMTGGKEIIEKTDGPTAGGWVQVFDLGYVQEPTVEGDGGDVPDVGGIPRRMTTVDLRGTAAYVGFCGQCDVITGVGEFANGIATNVGGDEPPEPGTPAGWHVASAKGLPNRYVQGISIDPQDAKTVYVALGGYGRRWVPPGANGEAAENVGEGHIYKSTDAGETFVDISGNLPDVPASDIIVRGGQLIAATDFGVFASATKAGKEWGLLGAENDLPMAPSLHLELHPGNDRELYVATFGRGIYKYTFADAAPKPPAPGPGAIPPKRPKPITPKPLPATGGLPWAPLMLVVTLAGAALVARRRRTDPA